MKELMGQTACLGKAGLAEGTNSATIQNATAIVYAIDGRAYSKAATDNIAITACAQQAQLTTCCYLVQINAAGTVSVKKGKEVLTADLGSSDNAQWPAPDEDNCAIGGFTIATASGYTYTGGTTDNGATGITDTYYDFALGLPCLPVNA